MERLAALAQDRLDAFLPLAILGDYNVCPTDADLAPGALPPTDALVRPESRAQFRALLHLGLTDALRALHPAETLYTYWDYGASFETNRGLRIDHALLSPELAERLHKLAILNVPHLAVMFGTVWRSWAQMRKSWYIFFFQIPRLPEASLRRNDWTNAIRALKGSARRGTFSLEEIENYRAAWSQPGAITGMVNWYRAAVRSQRKLAGLGRIRVPTLMIWGAKDIALGREMAQPSIDLCDHGRLVFIEEAGHFVQHEEPARVNRLLLEFLGD